MTIDYSGLLRLIKERGLSLTKLGDDLSLSTATRAKFKKGEYVSLQTLEAICQYLEASLDQILRFVHESPPSKLLKQLQEEMEIKLSGSIYHETQILLTYNSNHIEGSRLTYHQTRRIFETNTVGLEENDAMSVDDIIETVNHFRCVDLMIRSAQEPLSDELIKDLHQQLKQGTSQERYDWFNVGDYKIRPNTVGGFKTAHPVEVQNRMNLLLDHYETKKSKNLQDIIEFHVEFERIHPFSDGNGRVGRLIAFKECLRHGMIPFTIDDELQPFYYQGLREWNRNNKFLIDTCKAGQNKYKELLIQYEIEEEHEN